MFPILRMCQILDVSENGYYHWCKRGKSQRKRDDEQLTERIEDAYYTNRGHYGSPRIHAELKAQGLLCSRKRVARLMQAKQLSARKRKRKPRTTNSQHGFPLAPNLLEQDFTAEAPNTKWVSDFTYIETREGWLYLAGVLDVYSRRIVGWSMSEQHDTSFVKAALQMALLQRKPGAGLVHHSDRGSEYASTSYQMLLREHNIQASMSKKGDCYDNSMIESFWATLKKECAETSIFASRSEARRTIFEYIEVYYHRKRRHSSLDYLVQLSMKNKKQRQMIIILDESLLSMIKFTYT
ncbi:transposase [Ktedonospora formicarum]|uniref:Transposase n=1 Tax=Ktedonospora formicarum TaxID=2778364 RepID=A0A8J3MZW4_9CHLR|nr:transposase [Ktedonospora formicarum]